MTHKYVVREIDKHLISSEIAYMKDRGRLRNSKTSTSGKKTVIQHALQVAFFIDFAKILKNLAGGVQPVEHISS